MSKKNKETAKMIPFTEGETVNHNEDFKKVPLRFRYWRGWSIYHIEQWKILIFPSHDKEKIEELKNTVISNQDLVALRELLDLAPWALHDPKIRRVFIQLQYKEKIVLNKYGSSRGTTSPEQLAKVIELDIKAFWELVKLRIEGLTVQEITREYPTQEKIWRYYKKPARSIVKAFGYEEHSPDDWNTILECFRVMAMSVRNDKPDLHWATKDKDGNTLHLRKSSPAYKDNIKLLR